MRENHQAFKHIFSFSCELSTMLGNEKIQHQMAIKSRKEFSWPSRMLIFKRHKEIFGNHEVQVIDFVETVWLDVESEPRILVSRS